MMIKRCKLQEGFSLVEMMVALVIGLLLIAGVLQVFLSSKVTYSMQSGLSKVQENGRFAISLLSRDIRQAAYNGCSKHTTLINIVRDASDALPTFLDLSDPVRGQDNSTGVPDEITVMYSEPSYICDIRNHNLGNETIRCEATGHPFEIGDVVVATDCEHTAVVQVENNGSLDDRVRYRELGSSNYTNCTEGLGLPLDCANTDGTDYSFDNGTVMALNYYRYHVADNAFAEPALYRESITKTGGVSLTTTSNELVEGVEDMQILYGEDTTGDNAVNYYVPLDEINDVGDILSVRVSLLVRSIEAHIVKDSQSIAFNGETLTFTDGRLRKVFTSTIVLRNRL